MIRPIAVMGDPVLREIAREVTLEELASPEVQGIIDDMVQTMHSAGGVGLAAPQISQSLRICVIDKPLTVLVNPVVTPAGEARGTSTEGCLSVPDMTGTVERAKTVRVQALTRAGKTVDMHWTGFRAIVVQHEVDHLDGILYIERASHTDKGPTHHQGDALLPERPNAKGKTFVVESPTAVGGTQFVKVTFAERGTVRQIRLQPGGARVTRVKLSGVAFRRNNYPAGAASQVICGQHGLIVAAGDQLHIDLLMPKGKKRILAEFDFDPYE